MEAARDFIPFEDEGQGTGRDTGRARRQSVAAAAPAVGRAGLVLKTSDPSGEL